MVRCLTHDYRILVPFRSPASHTQYFYKNSPTRIGGAYGYIEPTSAIDETRETQELSSPDIGGVHMSLRPTRTTVSSALTVCAVSAYAPPPVV